MALQEEARVKVVLDVVKAQDQLGRLEQKVKETESIIQKDTQEEDKLKQKIKQRQDETKREDESRLRQVLRFRVGTPSSLLTIAQEKAEGTPLLRKAIQIGELVEAAPQLLSIAKGIVKGTPLEVALEPLQKAVQEASDLATQALTALRAAVPAAASVEKVVQAQLQLGGTPSAEGSLDLFKKFFEINRTQMVLDRQKRKISREITNETLGLALQDTVKGFFAR